MVDNTDTKVVEPQTRQMVDNFVDEEMSEEVLFDRKERDRGQTFAAEGGAVKLLPTGFTDEMRKGKGNQDLQRYEARPSAITLYSWNGSPSEVPIAYKAGGTDPSISRYLRKKHCNACSHAGFITPYCTKCGSQDVIRYYYVDYDQVPVKTNWYGAVPCLCSPAGEMAGDCPRDGTTRDNQLTGFLHKQQMLMHATSKHPREYGIWRDTMGVAAPQPESGAVVALRGEIAELRAMLTVDKRPEDEGPTDAVRSPGAVGTPEAPLYTSDKPKQRRTRRKPVAARKS